MSEGSRAQIMASVAAVVVAFAAGCDSGRPVADGQDDLAQGTAILDGAQRAMGVWPTPPRLHLAADAAAEGPRGPFRTVFHSSSDGRTRMEQIPGPFLAGVDDSRGWYVEPSSGSVQPLGEREAFVRSHELHMLALLPRSRLTDPRFLGVRRLEDRDVLAVGLAHPGGEGVIAYFSPSDTLPMGLRVEWADPDVIVSWSDWTRIDGVRVFRRAVFRQGDEEFRYDYERVELTELPDTVFEAPGD